MHWGRGSGGGTHVTHSRSCMPIDPRIPTMPWRSTSAFFTNQADIERAKGGAPSGAINQSIAINKRVACMKGELHPTKNQLRGGLGTLRLHSCIWMTAAKYVCFAVVCLSYWTIDHASHFEDVAPLQLLLLLLLLTIQTPPACGQCLLKMHCNTKCVYFERTPSGGLPRHTAGTLTTNTDHGRGGGGRGGGSTLLFAS